MNRERAKEYDAILDQISDTLDDMPKWSTSEARRREVLKHVHDSIDGVTQLSAMLLKDLGREVRTENDNLEALKEEGVLEIELTDRLKKAYALRDQIVMEKVQIDGVTLMAALEQAKFTVSDFSNVVDEVVDEQVED